jgi:hypothetical protein
VQGFQFICLLLLPAASVALEALLHPGSATLTALVGKWFVFFGVGVRLFMAGVTQTFRPQFTAESIFDLKGPGALAIVREVGFANLAMGTLGLLSLIKAQWVVPAAIVGGLYYGLAGPGHLLRPNRNFKEQTALVSDLAMFLLLAAIVASRVL